MKVEKREKTFKIVGIKGHGAFAHFATEVPEFAKQLLLRTREIENHANVEIALFEPKLHDHHLKGDYYVGVLVHDKPRMIPKGMDYMEITHPYASIRGSIAKVDHLYERLGSWVEQEGLDRDRSSFIVETYHPSEDGEKVEIFLPII